MSVYRLALACLVLVALDARAGGEVEPQIPDCSELYGADYEACVVYVAELLMEQQVQQQQRPLPPEQLDPIVIQVDGGGSSIGEWAALFAGLASVLGALEVFRRRRRGHQP